MNEWEAKVKRLEIEHEIWTNDRKFGRFNEYE
jgi:hypothetical protein